ncbi:hypothetical protein IMZ48_28385 [Candidatus Bathyarchaeota archaeon]|nr:hypothetical protein [Candidatus Bathyarchaeota archaeon]
MLGSLGRLDIRLNLRVVHLDEVEPPREVRKRAPADKAERGLVASESEPDLSVGLAESIAAKVRPEGEVLVQGA